MNTIDKVLLEWSLKTDKGYPDLNSKEDMDLFESMFGFKLNEEEENIAPEKIEKTVEVLRKGIESIKETYSKYLSVFDIFDPNSLGTISEILFAKLLTAQEGITANHTGGSQGLADITVNGVGVSIKTTGGDNAINLGEDRGVVMDSDNQEIVNALKLLNKDKEFLTVEDLIEKFKKSEDPKKVAAASKIKNRLTSIANKLAGPKNDDVFLWTEKVKNKEKVLTDIIIHVIKYDKDELLKTFMNGIPQVTGGRGTSWNLNDKDTGKTMVQGNTGKYLNIMPIFIKKTTKDTATRIPIAKNTLPLNIDPNKLVTDSMFQALDAIHAQLYKPQK